MNIAQFLGVSIRTARRYHRVHGLPVDKFGTKTVYLDVDKFELWKRRKKKKTL